MESVMSLRETTRESEGENEKENKNEIILINTPDNVNLTLEFDLNNLNHSSALIVKLSRSHHELVERTFSIVEDNGQRVFENLKRTHEPNIIPLFQHEAFKDLYKGLKIIVDVNGNVSVFKNDNDNLCITSPGTVYFGDNGIHTDCLEFHATNMIYTGTSHINSLEILVKERLATVGEIFIGEKLFLSSKVHHHSGDIIISGRDAQIYTKSMETTPASKIKEENSNNGLKSNFTFCSLRNEGKIEMDDLTLTTTHPLNNTGSIKARYLKIDTYELRNDGTIKAHEGSIQYHTSLVNTGKIEGIDVGIKGGNLLSNWPNGSIRVLNSLSIESGTFLNYGDIVNGGTLILKSNWLIYGGKITSDNIHLSFSQYKFFHNLVTLGTITLDLEVLDPNILKHFEAKKKLILNLSPNIKCLDQEFSYSTSLQLNSQASHFKFLKSLKIGGFLEITMPNTKVEIGQEDLPFTLMAGGKDLTIVSQSFDNVHGGIYGKNSLTIEAQENITNGRGIKGKTTIPIHGHGIKVDYYNSNKSYMATTGLLTLKGKEFFNDIGTLSMGELNTQLEGGFLSRGGHITVQNNAQIKAGFLKNYQDVMYCDSGFREPLGRLLGRAPAILLSPCTEKAVFHIYGDLDLISQSAKNIGSTFHVSGQQMLYNNLGQVITLENTGIPVTIYLTRNFNNAKQIIGTIHGQRTYRTLPAIMSAGKSIIVENTLDLTVSGSIQSPLIWLKDVRRARIGIFKAYIRPKRYFANNMCLIDFVRPTLLTNINPLWGIQILPLNEVEQTPLIVGQYGDIDIDKYKIRSGDFALQPLITEALAKILHRGFLTSELKHPLAILHYLRSNADEVGLNCGHTIENCLFVDKSIIDTSPLPLLYYSQSESNNVDNEDEIILTPNIFVPNSLRLPIGYEGSVAALDKLAIMGSGDIHNKGTIYGENLLAIEADILSVEKGKITKRYNINSKDSITQSFAMEGGNLKTGSDGVLLVSTREMSVQVAN